MRFAVTVLLALLAAGCSAGPEPAANSAPPEPDGHAEIRRAMSAVEPFFRRMSKLGPYDWLATFKEPGQTFDEYIASSPTIPNGDRNVIYVQPLGELGAGRSRIIRTASEYLEAFYGLRVRILPVKPLPRNLPEPDQRMIDYPPHRQIRTGWVMDKMLKPALPRDAAALIAFTNEDLYPDSSMYFVFGQASLDNRVGVWSLHRLDDHADFNRFMERTLKIAAHEVGHMFSIRHCTKYECVMSGTNHLEETDRRPIDACPECMAKIAWMKNEKPEARYERLLAFAKRNNLVDAAEDFARKLAAVR